MKPDKNETALTPDGLMMYPSPVDDFYPIQNLTKISFADLAALGTGFDTIRIAFSGVFGKGKSGIYKVTIPKGTHLTKTRDTKEFIGTALNKNNQISAQARLEPVLCNPTMLFMAAALMNMEQKLNSIQETADDILDFLQQKEKAKLRGSLLFLREIEENYRYNWNNDTYKNSNHIKVLDIKQEAEQSILFCKSQVEGILRKRTLIHADQDVRKKLDNLQRELEDYQISNYLYAMSSFLDVMLLDNRDPDFLSGICKRIENYFLEYKELYSNCYVLFEKYHKSSIQSALIKGAEKISKAAGEAVARVPVIKDTQIDENLIAASGKLNRAGSRRTNKALEQLVDLQSSYVRPFIESIEMISMLYNNPMDVIFDAENLYLKSSAT